ncbi:hypothetical protein [Pimelobacter simplex]|uniref:hypothetical protein n=1 Tax=Nocardioides simplex TaxID=2045 RepID=UPI00214F74D8|nr:hypothetical protein [Pimelobacter simplex]UUW91755.1 hypothetical protein M0M43_09785 [Pimelobacter simplex]UUW95583.1 hypothetical protein M0M48_28285 [Pimelobacter simplex]
MEMDSKEIQPITSAIRHDLGDDDKYAPRLGVAIASVLTDTQRQALKEAHVSGQPRLLAWSTGDERDVLLRPDNGVLVHAAVRADEVAVTVRRLEDVRSFGASNFSAPATNGLRDLTWQVAGWSVTLSDGTTLMASTVNDSAHLDRAREFMTSLLS